MIKVKIQPFKLERYFAQYEFKAPYLLSSSDCESHTIKALLDMSPEQISEFHEVSLGYTESEGHPTLRHAISELYTSFSEDHIFTFSGAEEGILAFMNSLLTPQDHIIVQYPAYQSLYEIAHSIGCRVSKWKLHEEQGWKLDLTELEEMISPSTKAIVINFPHNPTGAMLTLSELENIISFAKQHDLYVFSDEVYRFLEFDSKDRLPAVADLYEKGFSLGVMSKAFGLAGLRIGWIAAKDEIIMNQMKHFKDYTTICNSAPSEWLATFALSHKEKILERNLAIIQKNLTMLDHFFEKYCTLFEWSKPIAGSVGFVKIKIDQTAEEFCSEVVEAVGVLLLPSTLFNFGNQHFRIGFGRANLSEALVKFEDYLQERFYKGIN